jgi:hypothetical protein
MTSTKPTAFAERYRLYLDESGDHVFNKLDTIGHRFLCLLGCWFRNSDYIKFHSELENLKAYHLPHHPDDPVVLHREDMINARRAFKDLRDPAKRDAFDSDLLNVIAAAEFRIVAVVVDKLELGSQYGGVAAHPYHLGLGFMLQRYAGYLNHINRDGDVMAEARGGREDLLLKESYSFVYDRGVWMVGPHVFQSALTSRELKLKPKNANIAGLQLADLLGHPVKQWVLREHGLVSQALSPFAERLLQTIYPNKFNKHLYTDRIPGYGTVLYPKKG